ncbi:HAD family hydrolase [Vibrio alginolyticus]|jgi:putative hydrolase of the HAD superfamily|uniref:HAD family hydrolase n=1 Tax=Vibrio sp. Vb5029 TaxID=3074698 RepID=UPI002963EAC9|nr:HAD family hydrolase [Vibrio sp. Vb5029]MDW1679881.1 HAD family hydrolase [Vibrio sp. Vb5029]
MSSVYLFDWGDTLMVDFPEQSGKMCDWEVVQAVTGAHEALKKLSSTHHVYVATNAADSSESDIKSAFDRVGLTQYISGYFCKANLGVGKGTPEFFNKIINVLGVEPQSVVMVGDTYSKDIEPAITAGIKAIWFNPSNQSLNENCSVKQISHLAEIFT